MMYSPAEYSANTSFKCYSKAIDQNNTSTIDDKKYNLPVVFTVDGIKVQAFNTVPRTKKFGKGK